MLANTIPQLIEINDEYQAKQTTKGKWFMNFRKKIKQIFFIYSEASLAVAMLIGALLEVGCAIAFLYTEMPFLSPLAFGAAAILALIAFALCYDIYRDLKAHPCEKAPKNAFLS
jgi:hypothetical protein